MRAGYRDNRPVPGQLDPNQGPRFSMGLAHGLVFSGGLDANAK